MTHDWLALAVAIGMGVITCATRAGGLWVMRFVPRTRQVEVFLRHLAGSVLVALLAGGVVRGDAGTWAAIAASVAAMAATRQAFVAIGAGMLAAVAARLWSGA